MDGLILTSDLSKHFGELKAVEGVDLRVAAGEILALLGPNGAGKTTTIRMLASILNPTRGWARIAGYDTVEQAVEVRGLIGLLTEHHGLYTRMRPAEYLSFFGELHGMEKKTLKGRIDSLLEELGLEEARDHRLGEFSKGMRQKLAIARALLHHPMVLLLDEPTSAMDPSSAKLVRERIRGMRTSQRAIIVCTHNLAEAELLADRIAIISRGEIIAQGSPGELKDRFLGNPVMELHLDGVVDGLPGSLPEGCTYLEQGDGWVRYQVEDPATANPQLLAQLTHQGIHVITLSEVGRSLEEVYLSVVEGEQKAGGQVLR